MAPSAASSRSLPPRHESWNQPSHNSYSHGTQARGAATALAASATPDEHDHPFDEKAGTGSGSSTAHTDAPTPAPSSSNDTDDYDYSDRSASAAAHHRRPRTSTHNTLSSSERSGSINITTTDADSDKDPYDGEGLEVVISSYSDEVDAVEFHLPDTDGSGTPLDCSMSRCASAASLASSTYSQSSRTSSMEGGSARSAGNGSGRASPSSGGAGVSCSGSGSGNTGSNASTSSLSASGSSSIAAGSGLPPRKRGSAKRGGDGPGHRGRSSSRSSSASSSAAAGTNGNATLLSIPRPKAVSRSNTTGNSHSSSTGSSSLSQTKKPVLRRAVSAPVEGSSSNASARKKPGVVAMAKMGYQECVNAIIRPPRAKAYKNELLGPAMFSYCGETFCRTDFDLINDRGQTLKCSHWFNAEPKSVDGVPCVVYMHGNSSARLEVIPQLSYLLALGVTVLSFDFAGSGKSDGQYVSLGYYERDDLRCVIDHLRSTGAVSAVALWGRSMGAATALMHAHRDPSIAAMICDSSFADLTQLAEEMVERGKEHGVNVPGFVVTMALRMIRGSVRKQAEFDIRHCRPIANVDKCFVPALFVHGKNDAFIKSHHSRDIHERYAGDKNLLVVDGDHNSQRPRFMYDSAAIFLQQCLHIPPDWILARDPKMKRNTPPWFYPGALDGLGLAFSRSMSDSSCGDSPPKTARTKTDDAATFTTSRRDDRASLDETRKQQRQQIANDEAAAFALAAELDANTGMTIERQDNIQSSLMKMTGQGEDERKGSNKKNKKKAGSGAKRTSNKDGNAIQSSASTEDSTDALIKKGLVRCRSVEIDRRKQL